MAVALIGGAALGAAFSELVNLVAEVASSATGFKSHKEGFEATLTSIQSEFSITRKVLNRPVEEKLTRDLKHATDLVRKCSRVKRWDVYSKSVYRKKLIRLENDLVKFFNIKGLADIAIGSDERIFGGDIGGWCSVPGLPGEIIGFDRHLGELKSRLLLKDDETRVLGVSGPGGCGKTILAKMLCHDNQIKGTFGGNIIYVTVSRECSLKIIAQTLFLHYGKKECEFRSEEEAMNQIENLMREQTRSDNMLLVLDDVWSESLVKDLEFQIPGYRILFTSRSSFQCFSTMYELSLLNDDDARTLFCHTAFSSDRIPVNFPDDMVNKVLEFCKGLPLSLTVVGASLQGQTVHRWRATLKRWSEGESIFKSHKKVLLTLQTSVDALDELPNNVKECFLDMGLFPEDDRITSTTLTDMWAELYKLDDEGIYANENLVELSDRNLIHLARIRTDVGDIEGYFDEQYVTQHDFLRELAIYLSSQEPIAQRKRVFVEIHGNKYPPWWNGQTTDINPCILSISTDETFSSSWNDLNAPNVQILILNIRSDEYTLPPFIEKMHQLKVLIVTGYGSNATPLGNLSILAALSNLRIIRFEHVSVSPSIQAIFSLQNLKKLAFVTCAIGNALKSGIESPIMPPNLTDLEFNCCYDLKELPAGLCNLIHLQNLIITDCHELDSLPKGLGNLANLQTLRLHCCTELQELPESIERLHNLTLVDISDCSRIELLPEQIGQLNRLRVLNMSGCQSLGQLPSSASKLLELECVICDEERSLLWKNIESGNWNEKIKVVEEDTLGSFHKIVH